MVKVEQYEVPEALYYSKDFEWVKIEGDKVRVGITDYAQKSLREIVYAELPSAGAQIKQNEPYGTLESVKAVSDLISPITGTIEEVNDEVQSKPETLNDSPNSAGVVIDLIRAAKIALDRKISGALLSMPSYAFKHPPVQVPDNIARQDTEDWIAGKKER